MESTSEDNPPQSGSLREPSVEQEQFLHPLLPWLMVFIAGLDNRRELRGAAALKVSPTAQIRGDCNYTGEKTFRAELKFFFVW